jgi:hypothetical protein
MGDEDEPTDDLEREEPNVRENPHSIDETQQEEDVANHELTNGMANKKESEARHDRQRLRGAGGGITKYGPRLARQFRPGSYLQAPQLALHSSRSFDQTLPQ